MHCQPEAELDPFPCPFRFDSPAARRAIDCERDRTLSRRRHMALVEAANEYFFSDDFMNTMEKVHVVFIARLICFF
eukprot:SAG31_NODE_181_length_21114_cov_99.705211_5_plen_76_part_00